MSNPEWEDPDVALADIEKKLRRAWTELKDAQEQERIALSRRCAATNNANAIQKEFDRALEALKASAPANTDWKR